ncbi:MAG: host attachment protein [Kiritimatiellia bacterium]
MNEDVTWIVVADSARALIFSPIPESRKLRLVREMHHPESRQHIHDMVTDHPGFMFESVGNVRRGMAAQTNPKVVEKKRFSRQLAEELDAARTHNRMGRLILVAEPRFLGDLRGQLSSPTSRMVVLEIAKNLTQLTPREIQSHLPVGLFLPQLAMASS